MTFAEKLATHYSLLQYGEFFLRIVTACICGAVIGYERSKRYKEAGIRTHMIVCCAATLVMLISKYGFADLSLEAGEFFDGVRGADPARLAAQIISGVSFLGAGIIFRNGSSIKGLTTAAGIWATAGIGMAIGSGFYVLGIFTTLVVAATQVIMHRHTVGADSMTAGKLRCMTTDPKNFRRQLDEFIESNGMQIKDIKVELADDGSSSVTYELALLIGRDMSVSDITGFLEAMDGVQKISFEMQG